MKVADAIATTECLGSFPQDALVQIAVNNIVAIAEIMRNLGATQLLTRIHVRATDNP